MRDEIILIRKYVPYVERASLIKGKSKSENYLVLPR